MRLPNDAIRRVRHPIPTVNDISLSLNGAQYFSTLDLSEAYHQLELDEQCRYITTYSTHLGLYRYKTKLWNTELQYTLQTALQGVNGVKYIADDIIIFGSTRSEHDQNLDACLKRISSKGLRLNRSKCNFLSTKLSFFGQIFTKEGTRPDPKKVNDLLHAPKPGSLRVPMKFELRSFLGMANYGSKYIQNFATITGLLRELTKHNVRFEWSEAHDEAFDTLKQTLTSAPCMSYFDKRKDTYVTVDASPVGISAILAQKSKHADSDHQ